MTSSDNLEPTPAAPPAAVAPQTKSGIQRVFGVLFDPVATFADIARRPDILAPLLVLIVSSILSSVVIVPRMDFDSLIREQMSQQGREMSAEDMDRTVRIGVASAKVLAYAGPILAIIVTAIIAGILLLAMRIMGGEGTFKQAFSVSLYGWMPYVVASIVGIIIVLVRNTAISPEQASNLVMSNLGFLVDMKENPVAFALLSSIDIFTIWTLALFIIGFSFVSRFSRGKTAAIILTLWAMLVVAKVGLAAIGAAARPDKA